VPVDCTLNPDLCNDEFLKNVGVELPTVFDSTSVWVDSAAATRFAIDHLLPETSSDDLMVFVEPSILASGFNSDLVTSRKLFAMHIDGICDPASKGYLLFNEVAESRHWDSQHLLSVMGYNPKQEVENLCTLRRDIISLVSDFVSNLSFLSLLTKWSTESVTTSGGSMPPGGRCDMNTIDGCLQAKHAFSISAQVQSLDDLVWCAFPFCCVAYYQYARWSTTRARLT
jgi:hypothetical protein